ncbi:class I SAM-dependent methyltransferase [Candidatus Nitrospira neomarina]|uniref:Class I SAM-dependent methyltransferase n=1 Tax=Candidatus Nitrospira neomarina TaxID=3020899 RepID=A0AA96JXM2_9BACT|nr:class I SAM-dependent methyltransferase [Candidatus Nitrospira neomarina]WNM64077.1 class I SAM-dependent methyltransferase [Candidatus Nitrospira neomarina]
MKDKYDQFYHLSLQKENFRDVSLGSWPKNRLEAITAIEGKGEAILDIGCGSGYLLYQFRHRFNKLIGLEYSQHRLAHAEINLADFCFLPIQGTAEDLSQLASNSIDRVVSADTIEHIPDVYKAAEEMHRVLRPGGLLVINTPNIAFLKKRVLLMAGRFPSTSQMNEGLGSDILFDGGHFHYFTFRSLRLLLEKFGFKMVKKVGYGRFGVVHNFWPNLLSGGVQWVATKE